MSTPTDNLEQKAREWLNTEGYMHLGLRLTKRGHTGDSDLPEQVLAAFARSLAPAPPKVLSDEGLEAAAMEVIKAAWSKSSMVDGVKLLLDYFRMWRDRGGISFRTEPLPAPPKVLTDEKIAGIADGFYSTPNGLPEGLTSNEVAFAKQGFKTGMRIARDHGYLPAPAPPSGAVVEAGPLVANRTPFDWSDQEIERMAAEIFPANPLSLVCEYEAVIKALRTLRDAALASSPSEPTVDKQVDKIMEVVMTWYKNPKRGGLGFTMQDGIDLLRNEIKALLSR